MLTTVHIIHSVAAVPIEDDEDENEAALALTHPFVRGTVIE